MGKAIIQSHLGDSLYRVKLQFDNSMTQSRIAFIDEQLIELASQLTDADSAKTAAKLTLDNANAALNYYIDTTSSTDILKNQTELNQLTAASYAALGEYNVAVSNERILKLRKQSLDFEKAYLQKNCPDEIETNAWSAEYDTGLSGLVNTAESDYILQHNNGDIINDSGVWIVKSAASKPGTLQHPLATGPNTLFFNAAIAPAMQKFKPRYRTATILDYNNATRVYSVLFDGNFNVDDIQSRIIDNHPILPVLYDAQTDIFSPVTTTTALGTYFVSGDRVIVEFVGLYYRPEIIGYYSNPRQPYAPPPPPTPVYIYRSFFIQKSHALRTEVNEGIVSLFYAHYHTLTQNECDDQGLTYPHKIEIFDEVFVGTWPSDGVGDHVLIIPTYTNTYGTFKLKVNIKIYHTVNYPFSSTLIGSLDIEQPLIGSWTSDREYTPTGVAMYDGKLKVMTRAFFS